MKKMLVTGMAVLSLMGSVHASALALNSAPNVDANSSISDSNVEKQKSQLTPEQKAEREAKKKEWNAKIQESQKKWSALTDAQKNEIYDLMEKQIDIKIQMIDKYTANGVIDKDTAEKMKARLLERKTNMRSSGKMPMLFVGRWNHSGKSLDK